MRWQSVTPRLAVALTSLALLSGCVAGATSSPSPDPTSTPVSPSASPSHDPAAPPSPSLVAVESPSLSPTPTPTPKVAITPKPPKSLVGHIVTTLADDGLRVRSRPRISDDSQMREPLLPLGTDLYVLDGPVQASGYAWYDVVPLARGNLPGGWIASAGRDGEPWIHPGTFDCPPLPTDFRSLAAMPSAVGLACFARVPITVKARLISCNCDADGPGYTPGWFFLGSGSPVLLIEPGVTDPPYSPDTDEWFVLNLDPKGEHPDELPLGKVVEITGMFDHPAAARCTRTEWDGEPVPSQGCRLEFAVTRLVAKGS